MNGHKSWKWYGFAGHLIVSDRCAFHLCTRVGGYLISTVGAFYPTPMVEMHRIGSGRNDFYETMVFVCTGEKEGNPIRSDLEIDGIRYENSRQAELGHYEVCWRYHIEEKDDASETKEN